MKKKILSIIAGICCLLMINNFSHAKYVLSCFDQAKDQFNIGTRNVVINKVRLSDNQVYALERTYRARLINGSYWYDRVCGAWGMSGGPTLCFIQAGLNIGGPLHSDASNGDTKVFVNGRQLHKRDVWGLQLGPVLPGRYWVDGWGNFGLEGGIMLGNLWVHAIQRLKGGGNGTSPWASYKGGGVIGGDRHGNFFAQFGEHTWSNY